MYSPSSFKIIVHNKFWSTYCGRYRYVEYNMILLRLRAGILKYPRKWYKPKGKVQKYGSVSRMQSKTRYRLVDVVLIWQNSSPRSEGERACPRHDMKHKWVHIYYNARVIILLSSRTSGDGQPEQKNTRVIA